MKRLLPDLPPYDDSTVMTLREAIRAGHVTHVRGKRLKADQLQRWATRGCHIIRGQGDAYLFPTVKGDKERLTCEPWCAAWREFVARVRAAEVRRQCEMVMRCQSA